jgi:hypothetical protein
MELFESNMDWYYNPQNPQKDAENGEEIVSDLAEDSLDESDIHPLELKRRMQKKKTLKFDLNSDD